MTTVPLINDVTDTSSRRHESAPFRRSSEEGKEKDAASNIHLTRHVSKTTFASLIRQLVNVQNKTHPSPSHDPAPCLPNLGKLRSSLSAESPSVPPTLRLVPPNLGVTGCSQLRAQGSYGHCAPSYLQPRRVCPQWEPPHISPSQSVFEVLAAQALTMACAQQGERAAEGQLIPRKRSHGREHRGVYREGHGQKDRAHRTADLEKLSKRAEQATARVEVTAGTEAVGGTVARARPESRAGMDAAARVEAAAGEMEAGGFLAESGGSHPSDPPNSQVAQAACRLAQDSVGRASQSQPSDGEGVYLMGIDALEAVLARKRREEEGVEEGEGIEMEEEEEEKGEEREEGVCMKRIEGTSGEGDDAVSVDLVVVLRGAVHIGDAKLSEGEGEVKGKEGEDDTSLEQRKGKQMQIEGENDTRLELGKQMRIESANALHFKAEEVSGISQRTSVRAEETRAGAVETRPRAADQDRKHPREMRRVRSAGMSHAAEVDGAGGVGEGGFGAGFLFRGGERERAFTLLQPPPLLLIDSSVERFEEGQAEVKEQWGERDRQGAGERVGGEEGLLARNVPGSVCQEIPQATSEAPQKAEEGQLARNAPGSVCQEISEAPERAEAEEADGAEERAEGEKVDGAQESAERGEADGAGESAEGEKAVGAEEKGEGEEADGADGRDEREEADEAEEKAGGQSAEEKAGGQFLEYMSPSHLSSCSTLPLTHSPPLAATTTTTTTTTATATATSTASVLPAPSPSLSPTPSAHPSLFPFPFPFPFPFHLPPFSAETTPSSSNYPSRFTTPAPHPLPHSFLNTPASATHSSLHRPFSLYRPISPSNRSLSSKTPYSPSSSTLSPALNATRRAASYSAGGSHPAPAPAAAAAGSGCSRVPVSAATAGCRSAGSGCSSVPASAATAGCRSAGSGMAVGSSRMSSFSEFSLPPNALDEERNHSAWHGALRLRGSSRWDTAECDTARCATAECDSVRCDSGRCVPSQNEKTDKKSPGKRVLGGPAAEGASYGWGVGLLRHGDALKQGGSEDMSEHGGASSSGEATFEAPQKLDDALKHGGSEDMSELGGASSSGEASQASSYGWGVGLLRQRDVLKQGGRAEARMRDAGNVMSEHAGVMERGCVEERRMEVTLALIKSRGGGELGNERTGHDLGASSSRAGEGTSIGGSSIGGSSIGGSGFVGNRNNLLAMLVSLQQSHSQQDCETRRQESRLLNGGSMGRRKGSSWGRSKRSRGERSMRSKGLVGRIEEEEGEEGEEREEGSGARQEGRRKEEEGEKGECKDLHSLVHEWLEMEGEAELASGDSPILDIITLTAQGEAFEPPQQLLPLSLARGGCQIGPSQALEGKDEEGGGEWEETEGETREGGEREGTGEGSGTEGGEGGEGRGGRGESNGKGGEGGAGGGGGAEGAGGVGNDGEEGDGGEGDEEGNGGQGSGNGDGGEEGEDGEEEDGGCEREEGVEEEEKEEEGVEENEEGERRADEEEVLQEKGEKSLLCRQHEGVAASGTVAEDLKARVYSNARQTKRLRWNQRQRSQLGANKPQYRLQRRLM
ncbi:unnamed protein product [Closterium sp. Yama58-4]|nr:unnamed protein product [Closterium sp. Yama58-4]